MVSLGEARRILSIALLGLLVAAAGCGGGEDEAPGPAATEPGTPAAAASPVPAGRVITPKDVFRKDPGVTNRAEVEWGWMFELSGPLGAFGEPTGDGVKMAVKEINEAGGFQVGDTIYTIKLLEHDTRSDIPNTVAVTTQLVRDDQVKVIWGPASAGEPETTQITQPRQIIHICACQGREQTSLKTAEQASTESRWAFQTLPPVSALFPEGARDLAKERPEYKTFAILCRNDEVGRSVCQSLVDAYEAVGFELVAREDFPPDTTDYAPLLTRIKPSNPDVLLNFVDPFTQGSLLKSALELDVGRYYGAVALPPDLIETIVGPAIREKPVGAGGYPRLHVFPTSEEASAYFERYKAFRGGQLPLVPFVSLLTYDFTYMLVAAMQQAGSVEDTTKIADALAALHFDGVGEDDIFFNPRHIGVMGGDSCTVFGGQITCVHFPPPPEALQ